MCHLFISKIDTIDHLQSWQKSFVCEQLNATFNEPVEEPIVCYGRILKFVNESDFDIYFGIEYEESPRHRSVA
jgi:hypothetical protein